MDSGFDPGAIRILGVRYRAGVSGTTYRGKVYLDAYGWQEIDPGSAAGAEVCSPEEGKERMLPPVSK